MFTPWLALALAASFAAYSHIKRGLTTAAAVSVTAEVALITPFAAAYLVWLGATGQGAFGRDLSATLLLPVSGLITAGPADPVFRWGPGVSACPWPLGWCNT